MENQRTPNYSQSDCQRLMLSAGGRGGRRTELTPITLSEIYDVYKLELESLYYLSKNNTTTEYIPEINNLCDITKEKHSLNPLMYLLQKRIPVELQK